MLRESVLNIECSHSIKKVSLIDISGREIKLESPMEKILKDLNFKMEFNLSKIHAGIYLIKIQTDDEHFIQKIILN